MKTWIAQLNEPVEGEFLATAIQTDLGAESVALEQISERGVLQWTLNSSLENREQQEHIADFLRYHKGALDFWFDGGENGEIQNRFFVGYGDGARTEWLLPFRWIYPSSLVMSVDYVTYTTWTLNPSVGMWTAGTTIADGAQIHIEKAKMRFKAYVVVDNDRVYQFVDNFKHFASKGIKIRERAD